MSQHAQLKQLWLDIEHVAMGLAEVRDEYVSVPGGEKRFMQLSRTYSHLREVETALYEYLHEKRDRVGPDWDGIALAMCRAAAENAKTLTVIAQDEAERLRRI